MARKIGGKIVIVALSTGIIQNIALGCPVCKTNSPMADETLSGPAAINQKSHTKLKPDILDTTKQMNTITKKTITPILMLSFIAVLTFSFRDRIFIYLTITIAF